MGSTAAAAPVLPTLHVDVHGAGPDLVLLHGWGFDHRVWGLFAETLARRFRVHRVDLPGHGQSSGHPFATLDDAVASVASCVPPGATVCGWSLGGLLAMRLALQRQLQVNRLVLIGATPCFAQADGWPFGVPRSMLEDFRRALARDGASTRRGFATLVAHGSAAARAQSRALTALIDSGPPADAASLSRALQALHAADLRAASATLALPSLVIHGSRDAVVSPEAGQWLAHHLGQAGVACAPTLRVIDPAGHAPFLDAPEAVAQMLIDWHG